VPANQRPPEAAVTTRLGVAWLPQADERAAERLQERRAGLEAAAQRLRALLGNAAFIERAPARVVEGERRRLAELEGQLARLKDQ
jgi:valyl-tRNA synthetase